MPSEKEVALQSNPLLSDATFLQLVADGDREAIGVLFLSYEDRLIAYATQFIRNHELAKDIVQDSFVNALTKLAQLKDVSKVEGWLFAIVRHCALDELRRPRRDNLSIDVQNADGRSHSDAIEDSFSVKPLQEHLQQEERDAFIIALRSLQWRRRQAIELSILGGHEYVEIARILACTTQAVKDLVRNGKQNLRDHFENKGLFLEYVEAYKRREARKARAKVQDTYSPIADGQINEISPSVSQDNSAGSSPSSHKQKLPPQECMRDSPLPKSQVAAKRGRHA